MWKVNPDDVERCVWDVVRVAKDLNSNESRYFRAVIIRECGVCGSVVWECSVGCVVWGVCSVGVWECVVWECVVWECVVWECVVWECVVWGVCSVECGSVVWVCSVGSV